MSQEGEATIELRGVSANCPTSAQCISVAAGQAILEAMAELGVMSTQPVVAIVNGRAQDLSYRLLPGDRVRLVPVIAGG